MNSPSSLNIIFAGTPIFSAKILQTLFDAGCNIVAVYTQPDRPAGRGRKLTASPVKELAQRHKISVFQPTTLRDANEQKILTALNADLMIVVAYGLLLPLPILQATRLGCINIHASLLPRWRGAAPIQRAILAGDTLTGITTMQMDVGLDTGAILDKVECDISINDTSDTLHDKLAQLGSEVILKTLNDLNAGKLNPIEQDNSLATYAHKITKQEAEIDWSLTAEEIHRKIRAFNPWPVASTQIKNEPLRIWEATIISATQENKTAGIIEHITSDSIDVSTKKDRIALKKLQLPGGRVLDVRDILNSRQDIFFVGQKLG